MAEQMGEYIKQEKDKKRRDVVGNSRHPRLLDYAHKFSDFLYFASGSDHNSREVARKEDIRQKAFNEVRQMGIDERIINSSSTIDDLPENIRPLVRDVVLRHRDNY